MPLAPVSLSSTLPTVPLGSSSSPSAGAGTIPKLTRAEVNAVPGKNSTQWSELSKRIASAVSHPTGTLSGIGRTNTAQNAVQFGELLKLQVEVGRCQMRVELLSKVSESAMAAARKFQQNQ